MNNLGSFIFFVINLILRILGKAIESNFFKILSIIQPEDSDFPLPFRDGKSTYNFLKGLDSLDKENQYFKFIDECRNKQYPEGTVIHYHHIIPKHWFNDESPFQKDYRDSQENLIRLSFEDHIEAHRLLYELYQRPQDLSSYYLLKGNIPEAISEYRRAGALVTNALMKEKGKTFWDPLFQKEMAKRSIEKMGAIAARSASGKIGGRKRNLNRILTKNDKFLFYFEGEPVLCTFNCETGSDILKILQQYKKTPILRVSPLITGARKTAYGWSCEKI